MQSKSLFIVIYLVLVSLKKTNSRALEVTYAERYDHLDVDSVLNNQRMVNYYVACFLSKGPCPPQGLDIKRILPEALKSNCMKCTEKQKTLAYRSIKRLKKEYPKQWKQLSDRWDPDGQFIHKFETTFENGVTTQPIISLTNRFKDSDSNAISTTVITINKRTTTMTPTTTNTTTPNVTNKTIPPISTTTSTTTTTTTTTTSTPTATQKLEKKISTTFKTKPTTKRPIISSPFRPPSLKAINTNLRATVALVKDLKGMAIQAYRHKMHVLHQILGRVF